MKHLKTESITTFKGIFPALDPTDMPNEKCVSCSNINLGIEGELSSIQGMTKYSNTGLGYQIDSLWQINSSNVFTTYNGIIAKL